MRYDCHYNKDGTYRLFSNIIVGVDFGPFSVKDFNIFTENNNSVLRPNLFFSIGTDMRHIIGLIQGYYVIYVYTYNNCLAIIATCAL